MSSWEILAMFGHFLVLSLLSVGGAISAAPDMHRYMVVEHHWLSDAQFSTSVAIAQASPGPNVLFVAVLGWNVAGPIGALATLAGILLPSTVLTLAIARWSANRGQTLGARAFTTGMAPLTVGLLLATGWLLAEPVMRVPGSVPVAIGLMAFSVLVMMRTAISPIWIVAVGGAVGAMGWV
jgi:chromate transporter